MTEHIAGDHTYFTSLRVLGRCNPEHIPLRAPEEQPDTRILRAILRELQPPGSTPYFDMLRTAYEMKAVIEGTDLAPILRTA